MIETNKVVRAKHAALAILSGRSLPTLNADLKVSGLLKTRYMTAFQVTETGREKLVKSIPDGWTSDQFPPDLALRWQTEVLDGTQEIADVPASLKLTQDDLPQVCLGKDGKETPASQENRRGVADLIVALGNLFVDKVDLSTEKD